MKKQTLINKLNKRYKEIQEEKESYSKGIAKQNCGKMMMQLKEIIFWIKDLE